MSKILKSEDILKTASSLREKEIEVAEWGGSVKIKEFTKLVQQRIRKEAKGIEDEIDMDRMELLMFIHGVIDPVFTEENYENLRQTSASAIDKVLKEITMLSGITEANIKEAEKKFRAR
jgi:hypothetical protein